MKKVSNLTVLFWLHAQRLIDGKPTIYCRITIDGKRSEVSLQRSIEKSLWSSGQAFGKSQIVKDTNDYLAAFKTNLLDHYDTLFRRNEEITAEKLKNSILGIVAEEDRKKTFLEMAKHMNKEFQDKVDKGMRSGRTLKRHEISQDFFKKFLLEEKKKTDVILDNLNVAFCYDFEHYLSIKAGQSHNTYMKHIKNIKQVLIFSKKKCQIKENPFDSFQCSYIEPKIILLEQHEIDSIWFHPMPIIRLQEVRDGYIFCVYTAYAFTDSQSLRIENVIRSIDGEYWICKDRTKTKTDENVMLLPVPKEIIEKYNDHPDRKKGFLLPQISLQNFNAYLKEIATICGVNKELTSHTARFTFATTVTLENDVPIESVSKMMGHKSIRTTQRYAKVTKRKLTNNMQALRTKLTVVSCIEQNQNTGT